MNGKNKLTITVLLASLAAVLLAGGCGPTPTPTPSGESLEWEEIARSIGGGWADLYEGKETMVIVTDQEDVLLIERYMASLYLQEISNTDFSSHFVIAVFQGAKGYADYSVEVTDVRRDGNVIAVYAKFLTPPTPAPGEIVALKPIATSPYYVLRVKKTERLCGDFTFVLTANGAEIMRQEHSIP